MATYVIAFESTHAALAASKAFADAGVRFLTIPVPRAISAGCGIALKFEAPDPAPALALARASGAAGRGALYREEGSESFERVEGL